MVKVQPDTKARKKGPEVWGMAPPVAILLGLTDSKKLTGKSIVRLEKHIKRYRDA